MYNAYQGRIWVKNEFEGNLEKNIGKRKEGERIPKLGTQVEYKGKKYVSLKELSKDINVPRSPLVHIYY